jgi:hypothetical protein
MILNALCNARKWNVKLANKRIKKNPRSMPTTQTKKVATLNINLSPQQKGQWTTKSLEKVMDAMKKKTNFFETTNKHWHIPLTPLSNHLNGEI